MIADKKRTGRRLGVRFLSCYLTTTGRYRYELLGGSGVSVGAVVAVAVAVAVAAVVAVGVGAGGEGVVVTAGAAARASRPFLHGLGVPLCVQQ
jgi:hypothetical protein